VLEHMSDRLLDIPAYLAVAGFLELGVLLLVSVVALTGVPVWGWRAYWMRVGRWTVFAVLLLVVGCAGNSVFMVAAYERMYKSVDTVADFLPFIPFGQWVLDREWAGHHGSLLNGASLPQIRALWGAIAAGVWLTTLLLYRGYVREQDDIRRTIAAQSPFA
jgi:hypothetical protein